MRPGRDDKILTSWNALAIAGLARAAQRARHAALGRPRVRRRRCAASARAWRDGRLLATRRGDRAELNAYLDDHAFLLAALVELMQVRFRRAGLRLGVRARRRAARALRGSRARRLLLHEPRPREAVPSHQAGPRQRDAVGQRRGRAGARSRSAIWPPSRATSRPRERTVRLFAADVARVARRAFDAARGRCGARVAAGCWSSSHGDPARRARSGSARSPATYRPATIGARPVAGPPTCRPRSSRGRRPRSGAVGVRVPRRDVPAADGARSTTCVAAIGVRGPVESRRSFAHNGVDHEARNRPPCRRRARGRARARRPRQRARPKR